MHKHTIDWFRQTNIAADKALVEKRWKLAETVAEQFSQKKIIDLLRLFLFPTSDQPFITQFTDEMLKHDGEFPVSNNLQELRLMAGLVMVTCFEKSSHAADAFALGILSSKNFASRLAPAEPAIVGLAESYLLKEANDLRPDDFSFDTKKLTATLNSSLDAVGKAEEGEDAAAIDKAHEVFNKALVKAIKETHQSLAKPIQQLSEECGILWWLLNEYSTELDKPFEDLAAQEYALPLASELAKRTQVLPPAPSVAPLLLKALSICKSHKKHADIAAYITSTTENWRSEQLKKFSGLDEGYLTPIFSTLRKGSELGDINLAIQAMPKLTGIQGDSSLPPEVAALQYFRELVFMRAISQFAV